MFNNAQSKQAVITGDTMNYIEFGTGKRALIILPGLGDGLSPVHGKTQAVMLASAYKLFARDFTVFIFSRKNHLESGCSTRSMASEQAEALKALGLSKASVLGVSQGGMIAQYLAIDYPDLVEKLVLAVTLSKQNETVQAVVRRWIGLAEKGEYRNLMTDTAERFYSEAYLRKYRLMYPLLGAAGKPKSFNRFIAQANSCIQHDAYSELYKIVCPALVIGGGCDRIVGADASRELSGKIKDCELFIYENLGHAAYEEAEDFNSRILNFLLR